MRCRNPEVGGVFQNLANFALYPGSAKLPYIFCVVLYSGVPF